MSGLLKRTDDVEIIELPMDLLEKILAQNELILKQNARIVDMLCSPLVASWREKRLAEIGAAHPGGCNAPDDDEDQD